MAVYVYVDKFDLKAYYKFKVTSVKDHIIFSTGIVLLEHRQYQFSIQTTLSIIPVLLTQHYQSI